jgi:TRAP-type transport system small permease protein
MQRAVEVFETMTKVLHYVSGALIVGLMLLTTGNILGRWMFNAPVRGTVELTEIAMVAIVFLGFAYAQVQEDHIRVDILYERLGQRARTVLGLFAALVSFLTVTVMAWRLYDYSEILEASGRTTSSLRVPLYYVGWLAVAGSVIFALGVLATAFRRTESDPEAGPVPPPDGTPVIPPDER